MADVAMGYVVVEEGATGRSLLSDALYERVDRAQMDAALPCEDGVTATPCAVVPVDTYEAHQAVAEAAREALGRIADKESGWRFSNRVDPLEHARSVVEEMREVARTALARLDAIEGGGA